MKTKNFLVTAAVIIFIAGTVRVLKAESPFNGSDVTIHEKSFKISAGKSLKLETDAGDITISGWEKEEVYIKITGTEWSADKMEFTFRNDEDRISVSGKKESSWSSWFRSLSVKYEIKVPARFNNYIRTAGGDIKFQNIDGDQLMKTSGGDISVSSASGNLKISTSGGDISLQNVNGPIESSTSGGDISVTGSTGDIKLSTSGGDIDLKSADGSIKATTSGGDIDLVYTGSNRGIELRTSGGDISVKLPQDFSATADLSTSGGSIKCSFEAYNTKKISKSKFQADLNSGGSPLIAKTSGGSIRVSKQ